MIHEILPVGMLQCNCSIFGDESTREGIVVDPGDDISEIEAILDRHRLRLKAIVITHAHIDHIGGAQKLKRSRGAPVYMNKGDQPLNDAMEIQAGWLGMPAPERTEIDTHARDGDTVKIGSIEMHVLHTPGHTPGSLSLWIPAENKIIAGDTLFRESIGRTDLPGGDSRQILSSIQQKLFSLPDDAVVVAGHGPITTIGHEKQFNPFVGTRVF